MRLGFLLVFAAVPFIEIALLIKVGQIIGFWPTLLLIVLSAIGGTYVVYEQGFQVMGRAMAAMSQGKPPVAPVIDGMFKLLGGVLLIVPGFISDVAGLALLVPTLRHRFAVWNLRRLFKSAHMRNFVFGERGGAPPERPQSDAQTDHQQHARPRGTRGPDQPPPAGEGPIIEGEFQRLDERTIRPKSPVPDRPPPGR